MSSTGGAGIVVIGGGVIGCAIAYELAKAGERVTLLERNALAQEASWASAGVRSSPCPRAGARGTGVRTPEGVVGAEMVVLAAGAWSKGIGDLAGLTVPTMPVHGQMMAVADPPMPLRTVVAGGGMYLLPRADGTIAVGATVD